MSRYCLLFLLVLLSACRQAPVKEIAGAGQPVLDSFTVPYTGKSEISQTIVISDSLFYSFDWGGYAYTKYRRSGNDYQLQEKVILSNARETLLGFFIDSTHAPNFTSEGNTWFKLDTANKLYVYDTIRLGLKYLGDRFRMFSTRHRPLLLINERLYFSPIWVELDDYNTYLKEPCLVSVSLGRQDTGHLEFFKKPEFFKTFPNPRISYCFNGKEIVLLYPNSDTLYLYNTVTRQYRKKALGNPFYSQPESVDTGKIWDEVYTIKYRLANFSYEAIWYNKNTGHYVIIYNMPVDKSIKVPGYDDQPDHAIVLNERFEPLKYILFKERHFNSNVLQMTKGLAMPVYSKSQKKIQHDIPIKYYVYNF